MLASAGLTSPGAISLLSTLSGKPSLQTLDMGQHYATEDLGARYSWISAAALPALKTFILCTPALRYFALDHTAIPQPALNELYAAALLASDSLVWFAARSVLPAADKAGVLANRYWKKCLRQKVRERLEGNVKSVYGALGYEEFEAREKRKLTGPEEDYRRIDSVYRNRDAGMARRGLLRLEKWWAQGDGTLGEAMAA